MNSLGHAVVEESGWRLVNLRDATDDELQSLRVIAGVHRVRSEWFRTDDGGRVTVEAKPVALWSLPLRDVWAEALVAVCDEGDRRRDEIDNLNASWGLPAAPQDRR